MVDPSVKKINELFGEYDEENLIKFYVDSGDVSNIDASRKLLRPNIIVEYYKSHIKRIYSEVARASENGENINNRVQYLISNGLLYHLLTAGVKLKASHSILAMIHPGNGATLYDTHFFKEWLNYIFKDKELKNFICSKINAVVKHIKDYFKCVYFKDMKDYEETPICPFYIMTINTYYL